MHRVQAVVAVGVVVFSAWVGGTSAREAATDASDRPVSPTGRSLRDVVGVAHAGGRYALTRGDYLNEGADAVHATGSRVIKVWFTPRPEKDYPFNSDWPKVQSLVELAQTKHFRDLFAKPFTTFVLDVYAPGRPDHYYRAGMSPADVAGERQALADLTRHLMRTYRQTGKTFVLQNWEGDWSLRGGTPGEDPTPTQIKGMIDWLNARQDGVDAGRQSAAEQGWTGVQVLHACEVNQVARAMQGKTTVTNDVVPQTRCDLYAYSAYDVPTDEPKAFVAALDYLASKAPRRPGTVGRHVYVGEYGFAEHAVGGPDAQRRKVQSATETAVTWGAPYVLYWQIYCNEPVRPLAGRPGNDDMRGFWLIRPDGSRPLVTDYFGALLHNEPSSRPSP